MRLKSYPPPLPLLGLELVQGPIIMTKTSHGVVTLRVSTQDDQLCPTYLRGPNTLTITTYLQFVCL